MSQIIPNPWNVRPAKPDDIFEISNIYHYYVMNTIQTLRTSAPSDEEMLEMYNSITQSQNLPYIVVDDTIVEDRSAGDQGDDLNKSFQGLAPANGLGYIYVAGFRSSWEGYHHTVEYTVYVDPHVRGQGIGSTLLTKLFAVLQQSTEYPEYYADAQARMETPIEQVIACKSVDDTVPPSMDLERRFGFEDVGCLKMVGFEMGRWVNTLYSQRAVHHEKKKS